MAQEHHYQVKVTYDKLRKGTLSSDILSQKITIATPPEFPKGMPDIWSPEHYFVASVNGCLMTTFLAIAENFKLDFDHFESDGIGTLSLVNGKYMISKIILKPYIKLKQESDRALALKVIDKSEKACLISNSILSEIEMQVTVEA